MEIVKKLICQAESPHKLSIVIENQLQINFKGEEIQQLPECLRQIETRIKGELTRKFKDKKHSLLAFLKSMSHLLNLVHHREQVLLQEIKR